MNSLLPALVLAHQSRRIAHLQAALEEHRRTVTLGGPPKPCGRDWRNEQVGGAIHPDYQHRLGHL